MQTPERERFFTIIFTFVFCAILMAAIPEAADASTINVTYGTGGKIKTPLGAVIPNGTNVTVAAGANKAFLITAGVGYHVANITVDGVTVFDGAAISDPNTTVITPSKAYKYKFLAVNADHTVNATFAKDTFTVTVTSLPVAGTTGSGSVSAPGLVCNGNTCTGTYEYGTSVMFVPSAADGSSFKTWGGACLINGKNPTCTKTVMKNLVISAYFKTNTAGSLKIAEKVSVVEAKTGVGQPRAFGFRLAAFDPADPTVDYNKDRTTYHVEERSSEAFSIINEILCMMAQSKYDEMLNKGPYIALIDTTQCSADRSNAANAGEEAQNQSSDSGMPKYEKWTVLSSREEAQPQIVKAWIHEDPNVAQDEPPGVIHARVVITEAATPENPLGIFTTYFAKYPFAPDGSVNTTVAVFKGYLKSVRGADGKVILQFIEQASFPGPGGIPIKVGEKAVLRKEADGTGSGLIQSAYPNGPDMTIDEEIFNIAFNDDLFRRKDQEQGTEVCLSRNDFDETAWRYGLYDKDNGSRINRNSGFPIKKVVDGREYHGFMGYWGPWMPQEAALQDGDTVYKLVYGEGNGGTQEAFTVFKSGGKLKKHTRQPLTLGSIKGIPLQYHVFDPNNQGPNIEYRVVWTGTGFEKQAQLDCMGGNGCYWTNITPEPLVIANSNMSEINFWSQALGGQVRVKLANCVFDDQQQPPQFTCDAPSDASDVIFYKEIVMNPADVIPATFSCNENCPTPNGDGTVTSNWSFFDPMNPESLVTYAYTFDAAAMVLKYNGTGVLFTATPQQNQFGIMSGPLFEPTPQNLTALECGDMMPGNPTAICPWKAWSELPEYYTWETGPNSWNQFATLKKDGSFIPPFDPPLTVVYTSNRADLGYDNTKFHLEYQGFGNLHGIPGKCVDFDTGEPADCGMDTRWIPEFMIPEGTEVIDASDNITPYLVKPLEVGQTMKAVAAGNCAALPFGTYTLPGMGAWLEPALGVEPQITGAPAVIGGVVQTPAP